MMHTPRTPRSMAAEAVRFQALVERVEGRAQRLEPGRQLVRGGEARSGPPMMAGSAPFEGLENDVAAEPVRDDDVHVVGEDVPARRCR